MGCKSSKDIEMENEILVPLKKLKMDLEIFHQKYMLNTSKKINMRRIDYAQVLQVFYEKFTKQLTCDIPVRFEIHKVQFGLNIIVTKSNVEVEEFINFSPYYMSRDNTENPIVEDIDIYPNLMTYIQYR